MSKISEQRRAEILAAAAAEFCSRGIEAASIADIAARAGIGKSTIYEYFPSKEELFAETCQVAIREVEAQVREVFSCEKSLRVQLEGYCARILQCLSGIDEGPNTMNSIVLMLFQNPRAADISESIHHLVTFLLREIQQAVEQAQQTGEVRSDVDAKILAGYLMSLPNPHLYKQLHLLNVDDPVPQIVQLALEGICTPGTQCR